MITFAAEIINSTQMHDNMDVTIILLMAIAIVYKQVVIKSQYPQGLGGEVGESLHHHVQSHSSLYTRGTPGASSVTPGLWL